MIYEVGMGRTGTRSLALAMEILGYRAKYRRTRPESKVLRHTISRGFPIADWMADYDYVGGLYMPFLGQLAERQPHAQLIATIRDRTSWLTSCRNYLESPKHLEEVERYEARQPIDENLFMRFLMFGTMRFRATALIERYDRYLRDLDAMPNQGRLLRLDVGAGWRPLCEFLGKPEPEAPFPHIQHRQHHAQATTS